MQQVKIISIVHEKGGTGKTTTTINLGIGLANRDKRVLLIDADASGNLTVGLGVKDRQNLPITLATLMDDLITDREEKASIQEAIIRHPEGVDLLPANRRLTATENNLVNAYQRDAVLSDILKPIKCNYDYILIDCRPSISMTVLNALTASDSVIIPVQAQYFAAENLEALFKYVGMVKSRANPNLTVDGIVITMTDMRTNLSRASVQSVQEKFGRFIKVFDAKIPFAVKMGEAPKQGKSIFAHEPNSPAATAYKFADKGGDGAWHKTAEQFRSTRHSMTFSGFKTRL